jgi:hypothetical protein
MSIFPLFLFLVLTALANAQGPGRERGAGAAGGFGRGPGFAGGLGFGGVKVVTGKPYAATRVTTFTQVLSDGNGITRTNCSIIYRDSQGRIREEDTPNSSTCSTATASLVVIRDPVAGVQYLINSQNNTYRQFTFKTPPSNTPKPDRPPGPKSGTVQTTTVSCPPTGTSLTIDGTQTTRTIPAGEIGNSQPITITSTRCYSPDLQVVTYSERDDPRGGKTTSQLSITSLADQPITLFQLPSGLTLEQGPAGRVRPGR